ncbi:hypothetical protein MJH12_06040 [bacterium]|nr:hypothetical protein [bacterium]
MAYYELNDKYTPYLRYEKLDPNDTISNDQGTVSILGLNAKVDQNMFLKMEIDKTSTGLANAIYAGKENTELKMSLSIGF